MYENFNKKTDQNLIDEIVIKNSYVKYDAFLRQNNGFFSYKRKRSEVNMIMIMKYLTENEQKNK